MCVLTQSNSPDNAKSPEPVLCHCCCWWRVRSEVSYPEIVVSGMCTNWQSVQRYLAGILFFPSCTTISLIRDHFINLKIKQMLAQYVTCSLLQRRPFSYNFLRVPKRGDTGAKKKNKLVVQVAIFDVYGQLLI